MKLKIWQTATLVLISIGFMSYATWSAYGNEGTLTNADFIRFHVIANSDSEEDQNLKLQVRDGVLAEINLDLAREAMNNHNGNDEIATLELEESRQYVVKNIDKIEKRARKIIKEKGYNYSVKAELGVRWIPEKTYNDITFPAGNYEALNIVIGKGEGENWWCVLFPPLCLIGIDAPEEAKIDEKYHELTDEKEEPFKIQIKFKTLEVLEAK